MKQRQSSRLNKIPHFHRASDRVTQKRKRRGIAAVTLCASVLSVVKGFEVQIILILGTRHS